MSGESAGKAAAASGGIGIGGALLVLFVGLKLTGFIDWSWWWVLSPAWIPLAVTVVLMIFGFGIMYIAYLVGDKAKTRRREGTRRVR